MIDSEDHCDMFQAEVNAKSTTREINNTRNCRCMELVIDREDGRDFAARPSRSMAMLYASASN